MTAPATAFLAALRSVLGDAAEIPLHVPEIGAVDRRLVEECLESTFVSSVGPFVTRFEQEIADYTGAAHAVAVSNGTSALQVALVLAGVRHGDLVIVPALSFVATANAVVHAGGVPYFIDSAPDTLGMDPDRLSELLDGLSVDEAGARDPISGRRVAAVVPMHTLGHPVDIERIVALSARLGIPVVEDAAESLGSWVGTQHTGTFGRLGILSFNGNKIITTGGGGMILTDDVDLARHAKHLTTTAKRPHPWEFEHDEVAWNFRMPNLNAALGVAQLSKIDDYLARKREIARRYAEAFAGMPDFEFVGEPPGTTSNYWLCAVRVRDSSRELRDELLAAAIADGIQCRPFWNLLNEQQMYREAPSASTPVAHELLDAVISIPSSPGLLA